VGEFDHCACGFVGIANKSEREFSCGKFVTAQEAHAHDFGIKMDGALHVAHAQHGV